MPQFKVVIVRTVRSEQYIEADNMSIAERVAHTHLSDGKIEEKQVLSQTHCTEVEQRTSIVAVNSTTPYPFFKADDE